MEISGDHRFAAPREAVYRALLDPKALQASMPGCEKFVEVAPQSYDLTIRVGIAAILLGPATRGLALEKISH